MGSCEPADGSGGATGSQLDVATHTDERDHPSAFGAWAVALHEGAGEASICWSTPGAKTEATHSDDGALFPDRCAAESERRARNNLRRFCVAARINRLGTFTYRCRRCNDPAGCHCPQGPDRPHVDELETVRADIARLRRALNAHWDAAGLSRVPFCTVIEAHKDGSLHVHAGFPQYLDQELIGRIWGHGFVKLTAGRLKDGEKLSARERSRRTAGYLAKYLGKDLGLHGPGRKRYSVTPRIIGKPRRARFLTLDAAQRWLRQQTGQLPERVWDSADQPGWDAPPVLLLFYGDLSG